MMFWHGNMEEAQYHFGTWNLKERFGSKINEESKTVFFYPGQGTPRLKVTLRRKKLNVGNRFVRFGSVIKSDGRTGEEIKRTLQLPRNFYKSVNDLA